MYTGHCQNGQDILQDILKADGVKAWAVLGDEGDK
jgi:hypothetical protein